MRAVTGFTRRRNWGDGLWSVSNAEHPCHGCGVRKRGGVGEGVGGGGEERRSDGGGRGSLLRSEGGGTGGGEGVEALCSQRHLPPHLRIKVLLHHALKRQPHPVPPPVEHIVAPSHEPAAEHAKS